MHDYSIAKCTRRCAISGRGLEPEESYYSVIKGDGDDVSRIDIAASHWTGPDENMIGWWRNKMPAAETKKMRPAPNGVLLDTLSELLERPGQESLAYLLALLLVRRRVLHEEQTLPLGSQSSAEQNWNLICPSDGRQWHVPIAAPATESIVEIQSQLKELLFTDA